MDQYNDSENISRLSHRDSYTTSIMTTRDYCVKVQYRRKADPKEIGLGKEKKMLTAIRSSYLYLESLKNALDQKEEWGFVFVCSDKNELDRNTVVKDVGLS